MHHAPNVYDKDGNAACANILLQEKKHFKGQHRQFWDLEVIFGAFHTTEWKYIPRKNNKNVR